MHAAIGSGAYPAAARGGKAGVGGARRNGAEPCVGLRHTRPPKIGLGGDENAADQQTFPTLNQLNTGDGLKAALSRAGRTVLCERAKGPTGLDSPREPNYRPVSPNVAPGSESHPLGMYSWPLTDGIRLESLLGAPRLWSIQRLAGISRRPAPRAIESGYGHGQVTAADGRARQRRSTQGGPNPLKPNLKAREGRRTNVLGLGGRDGSSVRGSPPA